MGKLERPDHNRTELRDPALGSLGDLPLVVLETMAQGLIVWSQEGTCLFRNARVIDMLELDSEDLKPGTARRDFLDKLVERGDMTEERRRISDARMVRGEVFGGDRTLPSGRIVSSTVRPLRGGGVVVTFSDVTEARRAVEALNQAKAKAEQAEANAIQVLNAERSRQIEARQLSDLDEWLQSCRSLDELYSIVQRFMKLMLPDTAGELYVYSNSRDALDGVCGWNGLSVQDYISPDSCWALRRGRAYSFDPEGLSFQCDHVTETGEVGQSDTYSCIPIVAHGDTIGLLHIRFAAPRADTVKITDPILFANRCGERISMAIANVRLRDELHDQSIRDPLTSLYNRRYFMDAIRREAMLCDRKGQTFGLISFDVDNFKAFNDNHGHEAGDIVLRTIGARLSEVFDGEDVPSRMGGEEFAVLVSHADREAATARAEQLRELIANTEVRYMNGILPRVTISGGVAVFPENGRQPRQLLQSADQALYRAKEEGRNFVWASPISGD